MERNSIGQAQRRCKADPVKSVYQHKDRKRFYPRQRNHEYAAGDVTQRQQPLRAYEPVGNVGRHQGRENSRQRGHGHNDARLIGFKVEVILQVQA